MRCFEFIPESKEILTEEMLREAFLQGLQQKLGAAIQQPIKAVVDTKTALGVLYKVVSDPKYLDTVTFELKRALKRQSALIQNPKLQQAIYSRWPQGRTLADFFKALLLYAVSKSASVATNLTTDQAVDFITKQIGGIETLVGNIISTAGGSILSVMKGLGVADKLFFEILTYINTKITTAPAIQNKSTVSTQQPTLSKIVSESKAVDELKKDLLIAKKKGVILDYDGVGKIMEKIWSKHGMSGQELHDVFVKEVGLVPDTWIKKQKQVSEIQRTPSDTEDWTSNQKAKEVPGLKMVPGSNQYGYKFETLKGQAKSYRYRFNC